MGSRQGATEKKRERGKCSQYVKQMKKRYLNKIEKKRKPISIKLMMLLESVKSFV